MSASSAWLKVAGISGVIAVGLGAMGAHAFKSRNENMKDSWKIASNYHLIHTLALAISATVFHGRKRNIVCSLFAGGILLFSGACYTIVIMDQRKPFNYFAPVGGVMMMAGWVAFAFL